jgi:membrane protease YdiL (CAAX protease family)
LNARALFIAPSGLVRAPWRIIVFVAVLIAVYTATARVAGPVIAAMFRWLGVLGVADESWISAIALLLTTAICLRMIDKRPWRAVWLDAQAARPRLFVGGFVLGALAIGLPILVLIGTGWLHEAASAPGSWWAACLHVSVLLLPAALSEELLTRGYILSVLRDSWGWAWAIAATSIGFGLLHLRNPGVTAESIALVMLAGFFLASVVYATRSLYAAWMAHFAWNWTMAVVFHASVSGFAMEAPDYRYVDAGPDWATGGQWGPEGGLPAAIGMAAGIALLVSRRRMRMSSGDAPDNAGSS